MKKFLYVPAMLLAGGLMIASCGGHESKPGDAQKTETASVVDFDHMYICPMHCENSGSNAPGKCPVCGMDLVTNPDYKGAAPADSAAMQPMDSTAQGSM